MFSRISRRNFLLAGLTLAGTFAWKTQAKQDISDLAPIPTRILGKTGVEVPIFGLGGAGKTPLSRSGQEKEARQLIEAAFTGGIRYFDTAASYGPSEDYLGKVLPSFRDQIFLASKTSARDRDGAWKDLERSLKRLNTDHLDLWQMHSVSFQRDLDEIFGKNGAIEALEEAKAQKIVRFSGITGHHEPDVIAEGLRLYSFDTTLITLNAADVHHPRPFSTSVLPVAQAQNTGVIAMKVPAYGRLFKPGVLDGMQEAMGYSLSLLGVHCCIIAAETVEQLQSNIQVAKNYQPLTLTQIQTIEQKTAQVWEDNNFFRAWT